jgi:hypothetical protein
MVGSAGKELIKLKLAPNFEKSGLNAFGGYALSVTLLPWFTLNFLYISI